MSGRSRRTLAFAGVCAAAAIAYAPSFAVPFQFDDYARLGGNGALASGRLLDAVNWLGTARLIPSLTVVLNYRVGGYDPIGYHVVNFALHLLTTAGVFTLALALCRAPRLRAAWPPARALLLATGASLVFACHPVQTEAVTYVIQRSAVMAALFYVWSIVCYLHARARQAGIEAGRRAAYVAACAVLAVCAVLSKENAASLPGALLLSEWVAFGRPRRWRTIGIGALLALVVLSVPVAWKIAVWRPFSVGGGTPSDLPLWQRLSEAVLAPRPAALPGSRPSAFEYLLTQATVLPRYLCLLVLPWGLNIDPDVPVANALVVPVIAGAAFLAGFAALGVSQVRQRPFVAFAIIWFFVTLSVESSIIPIDDVMAEHRMYLPMVGLSIGIGWLLAVAVGRARRTALSAGAAVAAALIALSFARNVIWLSPLTLWVDAAEKSPDKVRPQLNAGVAYHQAGRLDEAVERYCRVLELSPDDPLARDNLAIALAAQGRSGCPSRAP